MNFTLFENILLTNKIKNSKKKNSEIKGFVMV